MKNGLILIALSSAVITACTSAPPRPSASGGTTHVTATATATASVNMADQKAAEAAVLRQSDVGSGYLSTPYIQPLQSAQDDAELSRCLGRPPAKVHETARAFSPKFSQGDARQVLASVTFVDSPATAMADLEALKSVKAMPCLKNSLLAQLRRISVTGEQVDLTRISVSAGEPNICAYRFRVVSNAAGQDIPQYLDLVSAVRGRAAVQATFQDVNQTFPKVFEERMMNAMLNRL